MAQHDMNIANQGFPAFRSDLNSALSAIISNSSGATEPSTTVAYQFWADTTNDLLKQRNAANDGWVSILTLSTGEPVTGGTPDKIEEGNSSVEVVDSGTGYVSIVIDGTETARFDSTGLSLPDNQKLLLGASDDLQIYHDGSHSRIVDGGTGDLYIQGNNMYLTNTSGNNYFGAISGGAATLYHNNSAKLATTSTGVNVTGALTVNGSPFSSTPPTVQTFTSSGTWNKPSGCKAVKVTVVGGGGGAGGTSNSTYGGAGGGGAGGFGIAFIDVTAVSSQTVTVGSGGSGGSTAPTDGSSGGSSSFGSYCTATGGGGGAKAAGNVTTAGGSAGTCSGADITIPVNSGGNGMGASYSRKGGRGADNVFGFGGYFGDGMTETPSTSASGYGAGGGGPGDDSTSAEAQNGGNGSQGIVIVEEFY